MDRLCDVEVWTPTAPQRAVRDGIAEIFGVEPHQLIGRGRTKPLPLFRHTAMWVLRKCFPHLSYPMVGRLFGGRDHSTVINGCRNVEARRKRDESYRELTDAMVEGFGVCSLGMVDAQDFRNRAAVVREVLRVQQARVPAAVNEPEGMPLAEMVPAGPQAESAPIEIPKIKPLPEMRPARARVEVAPRRAILPRNDFGKNDANDRLVAGSRALLAALQREGMVCR